MKVNIFRGLQAVPYHQNVRSTPLMELITILERITYKDWSFVLTLQFDMVQIGIQYVAPDSGTKEPITITHSGISLPSYALSTDKDKLEDYVLRIAHQVIIEAELHEANEEFRYRGEMIFDPHKHERLAQTPQPVSPVTV